MMFERVVLEKGASRWTLVVNRLYGEESAVINWRDFLPPNRGTKNQREYLLASVKQFLVALINFPRRGHVALSHATVLHWVRYIKTLVYWMIDKDLWRFSQLTEEILYQFVEGRYRRNGKKPSMNNLLAYAQLVDMLWVLRHEYPGSLRTHAPRVASLVFQSRRESSESSWKPIDESEALPLIRDAVRWIDTYGAFVAQAIKSLYGNLRRPVGKSKWDLQDDVRDAFAAIEAQPEMAALRNELDDHSGITRTALESAISQTEGACLIVLLFLVGLRCRELLRLDIDTVILEHASDSSPAYRLKGIAAKKDGADRTWVASEPVVKVIEYAKDLYSPIRHATGHQALFLGRHGWAAAVKKGKIKRMTPESVIKRIRVFGFAPHRSSSPKLHHLHPHAARKTFARFVILRDKRALESLSYHFGHTHRMITDGHYVGSDIELAKLIDEEGRKDLADGLEDILRSGSVAGKAGHSIETIKQIARPGAFRGRLGLKSTIEKLIDQGVQLAPCDWGYCVYSQALSACRGSASGPNEANRSPEVCSGCANFVVTGKHQAWWSDRLNADDAFLRQADISPQARAWVERRMCGAREVLRDLVRRSEGIDDSSTSD